MKAVVAVLSLSLAGRAGAQVIVYPAQRNLMPAVNLDDQFGHFHTAAALRGDAVVFVYGDKESAEANKALVAQLHAAFHPSAAGKPPAEARKVPVVPVAGAVPGTLSPDVVAVPVACVGRVTGVARGLVREGFKTNSPDVAVWLDFPDLLKQQFGFTPGVPNVAVLDTFGRLRCVATGPLGPEQFAQLTAVIEGLRREAVLGGGR
jgi:hypothetical protein